MFQENARRFHYFLAFKIHKHRVWLSVNFFSGNFGLTQILPYFFSDLYNSHSLLPLFKILPNVLAPHKQYLLIFLNHSGLPESRLTLKDRMP